MALHRDIFWIGRQWAVTGFGMQAINQKLGGEFDISIERLWDEELLGVLREQKWFIPEDFAKGLAIARARYPQPPRKPELPPLPVQTLLQANSAIRVPEPVESPVVPSVESPPVATIGAVPEPTVPPKSVLPFYEMRILSHPAKLLSVWRARRRA